MTRKRAVKLSSLKLNMEYKATEFSPRGNGIRCGLMFEVHKSVSPATYPIGKSGLTGVEKVALA